MCTRTDCRMASAACSATPNPNVTTEIAEKSTNSDGRKTLNQYTFLSLISRGVFCKVKLAQYTGDDGANQVAVKIYSRRKLKRSVNGLRRSPFTGLYAQEVALLRELGQHENIVQLYEFICQPDMDKVYLVLEYLRGGPCIGAWDKDTATFVGGGLPEMEARYMITDVLAGLEHMHNALIAHGDVKPANILRADERREGSTDRPRFVICDLASAKQYTGTEMDSVTETSTLGKTHAFFSPEMCGGADISGISASRTTVCEASYSLFRLTYGLQGSLSCRIVWKTSILG